MQFRGLAERLEADCLFEDEATRAEFAGDKWARGPLPELVVRPRTTEGVRQTLLWANEHRVPVTTRGAGWGYVGGAITNRGGLVLSLDRMNAIREVSRRDFVAVVEAGAITDELQRAAREVGLFYPPDPASSSHSTLGGNIAANAGGPRCLKYGVTRSYVLGLEVVLANGEVLHLGGRTHKNKTGFDMLGLFVGSEGLLGVVTGATLRLLPYPRARVGLAATFATLPEAAAAVNSIFEAGVLPAAVEVADATTLAFFRVAQGLSPDANAGAHLLIECDGHPEGARAEQRQIAQVLQDCAALHLELAEDEVQVEALWAVRRAFSLSLNAPGHAKLNEDIVVPRGKLVDLVEFARTLGEKHGLTVACFGHAGDGNIHVNFLVDLQGREPESAQLQAEAALDELFAQVLAWGGAITGEHGIGLAKKKWWPAATSPEVRGVHQLLKQQFDPNGILNPGKWL